MRVTFEEFFSDAADWSYHENDPQVSLIRKPQVRSLYTTVLYDGGFDMYGPRSMLNGRFSAFACVIFTHTPAYPICGTPPIAFRYHVSP